MKRWIKVYKHISVYMFDNRYSLNEFLMMLLNFNMLNKVLAHGNINDCVNITKYRIPFTIKQLRKDFKGCENMLIINYYKNLNNRSELMIEYNKKFYKECKYYDQLDRKFNIKKLK